MEKLEPSKWISCIAGMVISTATQASPYQKGTLSLEPVIIGLGNYSIGFEKTDSQINRTSVNVFKAANGYMVSEVEKFNTGYSA